MNDVDALTWVLLAGPGDEAAPPESGTRDSLYDRELAAFSIRKRYLRGSTSMKGQTLPFTRLASAKKKETCEGALGEPPSG